MSAKSRHENVQASFAFGYTTFAAIGISFPTFPSDRMRQGPFQLRTLHRITQRMQSRVVPSAPRLPVIAKLQSFSLHREKRKRRRREEKEKKVTRAGSCRRRFDPRSCHFLLFLFSSSSLSLFSFRTYISPLYTNFGAFQLPFSFL